jgi:hypothetical protein
LRVVTIRPDFFAADFQISGEIIRIYGSLRITK